MILVGNQVEIVDNATGELLKGRVVSVTLRTAKVRLTYPEHMRGETIRAFRLPLPDGIKDCYVVLEDE